MFTQTMQNAENCFKFEVNFNDSHCNHGLGRSPQPRSAK